MKQKIYSYIQQNQIINSGDYVLAGVSGGADSVCLFFLLYYYNESEGDKANEYNCYQNQT